jgi:hypothetical protein
MHLPFDVHEREAFARMNRNGIVPRRASHPQLAALATLGNYKSPTAKECRKA